MSTEDDMEVRPVSGKRGRPPVRAGGLPAFKVRAFAEYELLEELAHGGMGTVFKARQKGANRVVALKVILNPRMAAPEVVRRFKVEAEATAKLHHPHIVPIYAVGEFEGQHYYAMQLVEGGSLEKRMAEWRLPCLSGGDSAKGLGRGALRAIQSRSARMMACVAQAVHYAHVHGVLHRDLKPGNILIDDAGEPHLTDFGVARLMDDPQEMTRSGVIVGTPGNMSPEQAAGEDLSVASDVFSLGTILYELLTGQPPFKAETTPETLRRVTECVPAHPRKLNPAVHPDLASICLKCLEKEPRNRYASAAAFAEELERWLRREPVLARRSSYLLRARRWAKRYPLVVALILGLALGLSSSLVLLKLALAERTAKASALALFESKVEREFGFFWGATNVCLVLRSEELAAIAGKAPVFDNRAVRIRVGLISTRRPVEATYAYGRLVERLEASIAKHLRRPVRLDLHLYKDESAAAGDLAGNRLEVAELDPRDFLRAKEANAGLLPLVWRQGPALVPDRTQSPEDSVVVFTRADTGITNLAGLKGRSLVLGEKDSAASFWCRASLVEASINADLLGRIRYAGEPEDPGFDASNEAGQESGSTPAGRVSTPLRAVLSGEFDAAATWEKPFRRMQTRGQLVLLGRFPALRRVWVAGSRVTPETSGGVVQSLLNLAYGEGASRRDGPTADFLAAKDADFDPVRRALERESMFAPSAP